jgi:transcriptional regulator with XRE-family HTH domain
MCENKELTMKVIGERFSDVRHYMLFSQKHVAEQIGTTVAAVSKIENGKNVNSDVFFRMLQFYAQYISLDFIVAKDFSVANADNYVKSFSLNTVVKAKIDMIRNEMNTSLEKTRKLIEQQLKDTSALL